MSLQQHQAQPEGYTTPPLTPTMLSPLKTPQPPRSNPEVNAPLITYLHALLCSQCQALQYAVNAQRTRQQKRRGKRQRALRQKNLRTHSHTLVRGESRGAWGLLMSAGPVSCMPPSHRQEHVTMATMLGLKAPRKPLSICKQYCSTVHCSAAAVAPSPTPQSIRRHARTWKCAWLWPPVAVLITSSSK